MRKLTYLLLGLLQLIAAVSTAKSQKADKTTPEPEFTLVTTERIIFDTWEMIHGKTSSDPEFTTPRSPKTASVIFDTLEMIVGKTRTTNKPKYTLKTREPTTSIIYDTWEMIHGNTTPEPVLTTPDPPKTTSVIFDTWEMIFGKTRTTFGKRSTTTPKPKKQKPTVVTHSRIDGEGMLIPMITN